MFLDIEEEQSLHSELTWEGSLVDAAAKCASRMLID